ncbi:MAG TPA: hypothetical protein VLA19_09055 [Herpetosiphonaceae bacterium]|nr:hypothetical protein [Herpetosiphonaceae bacterium]
MSRRLLVLKCSARKRGTPDPIPAIERYDGPLWQVLRSMRDRQPLLLADLDVYALSAGFGLISATTGIAWYDQTMDSERADELRPAALRVFSDLMAKGYDELCLGLSHRYIRAIEGWEQHVPASMKVTITDGPMGVKLGQLRAWLNREEWTPEDRPTRIEAAAEPRGSVQLRGQTLAVRSETVLEVARRAIKHGSTDAARYREWYVSIDGARVGAKWLVSEISGLPTTAFDASAARRVLRALGITVERDAR